ncbi:hypothetical protein TUMSATVNIG1_59500 (plasmid) [Vibrio nigripulchritudo]|uniref:DUF6471 domain-containing protein n=1 Tax=Vibrio nigripulchritudo TaxID=28173 RepID=UPI00190D093C|nr:DUF6471 domain-containing protein [Vibrio nigripulchritudo]BCL73964.1 hypothetical protein VNTUMSATTG_59010 [Vibrio nigripulchritudo]BDU35341.1 hypothetical protein TUMSATVNIG1_59500 [Vibrio nigripulchritudo]
MITWGVTISKQKKSEIEKELDKIANDEIAKHIRSEMALHGVTAPVVAKRLSKVGRPISAQGLRNKISKGTHQTMWYWDLMKAIRQDGGDDDQ